MSESSRNVRIVRIYPLTVLFTFTMVIIINSILGLIIINNIIIIINYVPHPLIYRYSLYVPSTISWLSKKQAVVALSTSEAEYIALSLATQEAVWLRRLLTDLMAPPDGPTILMEDNQGAIAIARNPIGQSILTFGITTSVKHCKKGLLTCATVRQVR